MNRATVDMDTIIPESTLERSMDTSDEPLADLVVRWQEFPHEDPLKGPRTRAKPEHVDQHTDHWQNPAEAFTRRNTGDNYQNRPVFFCLVFVFFPTFLDVWIIF